MYGILHDGVVIAEFVAPLDFLSNQPVTSADALSLKRTVAVSPSQRWELECKLAPQSWTANQLFVHFTVKGRHTPFNLRVPQNTGVMATRTSNSSMHSANGAKGSDRISITGWSGIAPAGTFIRFQNHSKIYMITEAIRPETTSFGIYPPLRQTVSGVSFNHRDDVEMPAWLDTDAARGMRYSDGILMDLGVVKFVEKI